MFERLNEVKVLRDPVHGYIHIDLKVIWDVLNSAWFQRLRRIRQLGGAVVVYHCAEHTRFEHSLGVYEIVRRMVTEVPDLSRELNEKEKVTAELAAMLHDIGHGPYSHAFEGVTNTSHEVYTCRIIEENTEITKILEDACPGLSKDVADVIRHESSNPILSQLISSQLDADRFDYLIRDAYFTGTKYGEFDMERILRTMRVDNGRLAVKESGVYAVENYIMARYHMYWQVYYHPVARSYECVLHMLFKRLKDLGTRKLDPSVIPLFIPIIKGQKIPLHTYFDLDEYACAYGFAQLVHHKDPITADLARRIRDRDLFEYADSTPSFNRKMRSTLKKAGYDLNYYWGRNEVEQNPYKPYSGEFSGSIWVRMKDGSTRELSNASNIVYSLIHGPTNDDNKVFFPDLKKK
jgi:HD superfamily phosphohydrolase